MMRACVTCWLLWLLGCVALGHSDPIGEIHPEITVVNGEFVVRYRENLPYPASGKSGEIRLNPDGKELGRATRAASLQNGPYYSFPQIPEEESGHERKIEEGWMIVPEYNRKHRGEPYLNFLHEDRLTRQPLHWSRTDVHAVEDVLIEGKKLYLLVTRIPPKKHVELWLTCFSMETFRELGEVRLPDPEVIYSFPVCSGMIFYKGRVYVAVCSPHKRNSRLWIVAWDGRSTTVSQAKLTDRIDWNTSISLEHIKNRALVAYHYPGADTGLLSQWFPKRSQIRTIAFDLDKKPR